MGLLDYFSVFDLWQAQNFNKGAAAFPFYCFTISGKHFKYTFYLITNMATKVILLIFINSII